MLFAEGLATPGRLAELTRRARRGARRWREPFTPEAVAPATGIDADDDPPAWRASSPPPSAAAVYGRIGTTTQEFGTLASWLVDVLNVLTGNLDRPGGAMFPRAAAGQRNAPARRAAGAASPLGRWHSRVRGLPESLGELPVAASPRRSRRRARARCAR